MACETCSVDCDTVLFDQGVRALDHLGTYHRHQGKHRRNEMDLSDLASVQNVSADVPTLRLECGQRSTGIRLCHSYSFEGCRYRSSLRCSMYTAREKVSTVSFLRSPVTSAIPGNVSADPYKR